MNLHLDFLERQSGFVEEIDGKSAPDCYLEWSVGFWLKLVKIFSSTYKKKDSLNAPKRMSGSE